MAQVLHWPNFKLKNVPWLFGVFFPGPLACVQCWLEDQLLNQVHNCSQINQVNHCRPLHGLAWPIQSHSKSGQHSSSWGDSQSQPGLHWQGVFCYQLALARSVSCRANMGILDIQVDVLTSDIMAQGGGAAGPVQDVQHQPGDASVGFSGFIACTNKRYHHGLHSGSIVV